MTKTPRANWDELVTGLGFGLIFGLALQKAGVADYDVILRTLLLEDLLVLKVMMSAVVVGAIGVYAMYSMRWVGLCTVEASVGRSVLGGLIFGVGFGLLGYCPGTMAAATAEGRLDALLGGVIGMLAGSFLFAQLYPSLKRVFSAGYIGDKTIWQALGVNHWVVVLPMCAGIVALLWWVESIGR
jgi:uncharacterized membrane protein YedE/YeeE